MIDNYSSLSKLSQFSKTLILQQFHSFVTMVDDQKILTGIKNTDVAYACTHQYLNPLDIVEKWWTIVDRVRRRPCSERRDIQLRIYQFTCRNNSTVHVDTVHKSSPSSDVNSVVEFCPSVSIPQQYRTVDSFFTRPQQQDSFAASCVFIQAVTFEETSNLNDLIICSLQFHFYFNRWVICD